MSTLLCTQAPQVIRPLANFPPSMWGNLFTSFSVDVKARDIYALEHEGLKEKVRMTLSNYTRNYKSSEMIDFINTVERLGVSYHFEKEIEELLHGMFDAHSKFQDVLQDFDLFTLGIYFRILRQHGYKISCDIFNKFKGDNGEFKDELKDDVIGMLSLYEATQLRTHGESILDEALEYTKSQLESMAATSLSPHLAKQITYALTIPLYKGIPRLEARNYITFYEEDPNKNYLLLRFSKIDFNLLQMIHKQELCDMSRWWKDWEFESKLSYARNRVVEAYFWILSVYCEPKYSLARIILGKILLLLSVIDDTYDAYGTRDELELFTDAIQRWDMSAITELPDYMKFVYRALLENYYEIEDQISKQENNCSYGIAYSIDMFKELARSYDIESIWSIKKYVPSFEEYLQNGLVTGANRVLITSSFLGMGNIATTEAYEWVQTHKINVTSNIIVRLLDDIMSHEEEGERAYVATGVECYGKEHGLNREQTVFELRKVIENGWKDFNEEFMKPNNLPLDIRMRSLNLTRVAEVAYKYDDGYTHPEKTLKTHINALLVNPIII